MRFYLGMCVIILMIISTGCIKKDKNSNRIKNNNGYNIISIDVSEQDNVLMSSYIKSVEYIPLETNNESLIYRLDKMIVYDDFIYILDKKQDKLLVFDLSGVYIRAISAKGRGPGEYSSISDFTIDSDKVILSDLSRRCIYTYDLAGNYVESIKLKHYNKFIEIKDDYMFVYCDNRDEDFNLYLFNKEYDVVNTFLPSKKYMSDFQSTTGGQFSESFDNKILFKESLSQWVYEIDSQQIKKYYYIDFNGCNLPEDYFKQKNSDLDKLLYDLNDGTYAVYPSILMESENIIYFNYVYDFSKKHVFVDKVTDLVSHGDVINDIDGFVFERPMAFFGTDLYGAIDPSSVADLYTHLKKRKKIIINGSNIEKSIGQSTISDNPIICKYTLK